MDGNGNVSVYHSDGLGSVRALTDASGTVTQTDRTDAFGLPVGTESANPPQQPFSYTGAQHDYELQLVDLGPRSYFPAIGRFLRRDPLAGAQAAPLSLNRYSYAGNNPTSAIDPSGLCQDPATVLGGAVGSGLRYCIERFIPTASARLGDFYLPAQGDNRGPSATGGTFRLRQFVYTQPNGQPGYDDTAGVSAAGPLLHQGFIYPGACTEVAKSNVLGGREIVAGCEGYIGLLPPFGGVPSIQTSLVIDEAANGAARLTFVYGTPYPSLEVWQYGGPNGPQLLYFFDAVAAGTSALDLYQPRLLYSP